VPITTRHEEHPATTVAVLGECWGDDGFVGHVAVVRPARAGEPTAATDFVLFDMDHTLTEQVVTRRDLTDRWKIIGWCEGEDVNAELMVWLQDMVTRMASRKYRERPRYQIDPPFEHVAQSGTNRKRGWRFSCVGFALWCFREAGVELLELPAHRYPEVNRNFIVRWYGDLLPDQSTPQFNHKLERLGLPGKGPWRIVLPGYIFRSLMRTPEEIGSVPYYPNHLTESSFPDLL
jgi:hypothetical protein